MAFTDRDGFIVTSSVQFDAEAKKIDEIRREVMRIRRLLEGTQQPQRRAAASARSPGRQTVAGVNGRSEPLQTGRAFRSGPAANSRAAPSGPAAGGKVAIARPIRAAAADRTVQQRVPGSQLGGSPIRTAGAATRDGVSTPASRGRDRLGRFTPGARLDPGGSAGSGTAADDADDRRMRERQNSDLIDAIKGVSEGADNIDPAVTAANEVARAVQPVARGISKLFGKDPQKQQVGWLKKIWKTLSERDVIGSRAAVAGPIGSLLSRASNFLNGDLLEGGLGGLLAGKTKSIFGALKKAPAFLKSIVVSAPGALASAGRTAAALPGRIGGNLLSRGAAGLRAFGSRGGILGALIAAGFGVSDAIGTARDKSLTPEQRRDKQLTNAASTGANISGGLLGAALGTAILPGLGTIVGGVLGATFGPGLISTISDSLSPLIGAGIDFIKGVANKAVGLYDKAVDATSRGIEVVATSAPVRAIKRGYDAAVDITSRGIEVAANAGKYALGHISALFETSGRGVGTISKGTGDFGGKSYGAYQLATNNGSLQDFLRSSPFGAEFAGLQPGSPEFDAKYRQVAKDPAFADAQHQYITNTHYAPQLARLRASGIDLGSRGKAVHEAVFSTAVQFGAKTGVIQKALKGSDIAQLSDADIIGLIQDYKAKNNSTLFKSSSAAVQASTLRRAANEKAELLKLAASGGASALAVTAPAARGSSPAVAVPSPPKPPEAPRIPLAAAVNPIVQGDAPPPQDISQNLSDRLLAHIQTGGIGSKS